MDVILAAMSSSRSDGVTQFVCMLLFFTLVSLEFVVHLNVNRVLQCVSHAAWYSMQLF